MPNFYQDFGYGPLANSVTPGSLSTAQYAQLVKLQNNDTLATGAALTDVNTTVQPFTDVVSRYAMANGVRSANRTVTLGVTGATAGLDVLIVDFDTSANTLTVVNGGTNGGNLGAFPTSHTKPMGMWCYYNGADWIFNGFVEIVP